MVTFFEFGASVPQILSLKHHAIQEFGKKKNTIFLQQKLTNVFSSPELKAQVSYSDRLLSAVCLSVNFYIFDFFSRTTGPILTKLGTNHPGGRGF
jgi:hypothetical protein